MADKPKRIYYGDIKVKDGEYEKDGKTKSRYHTIGKMYHTPHMSMVSIYLYPTATSEGKWLNAYPHEEYEKPQGTADVVHEVDTDKPINLDDIPF